MSTTERLLDAAEYRMRRSGYNAVSFRDLATDVDIRSASVHYHFPKKEDLAIAMVTRYAERFFDALEAASGSAKNTREKIEAFRSVYRKALKHDGAICLCGLLGAEAAGLPDVLTQAVQEFFRANINWVAAALPTTRSTSVRRKQAQSIVAAHQGAMMLATNLGDKRLFDTATSTIIDYVLRAET